MTELPARIKRLGLTIAGRRSASLLHESTYVLTYDSDDPSQPAASVLLPASQAMYQDGDLFPSMDMNLPEGFLFQRIVDLHPKQPLTKMHLLALMGANGIGRVGYVLDGRPAPRPLSIERSRILEAGATEHLFRELVAAYLSTGAGISGVQPKIMVPTRATTPIPDLIVKTAGSDFPHLAVNEFLCLGAARAAGIATPVFDLSADGAILVLDRFDLGAGGLRLGFEDMAALMGLRVNDRLSTRKYHGSYEAVAEVIRLLSSNPAHDLQAFFEQLALSVMVRNGDAHLKNFGMLYTGPGDVRLSPLFDVVTTAVYRFERPGGAMAEDRTLALKWRRGRSHASRAYPGREELFEFGRHLCGVRSPREIVARIADGMARTLAGAAADARVPAAFLAQLRGQWEIGLAYAS